MADTASKTHGSAPANTLGQGASQSAAESGLPDLTGRTLGDYQILRRLGVGGMGQVYLARQLSLKREVALKLLRDDLNKNPTALLRFQAEAEAVARLNHPNIVHIHQMGEAEGLRYMALEYVEGRNLRDHLARKGPPDLAVTLSIIRQVVLAIQQAHEQGIVHRDIKPENILVTRKVEVKVTDFGLSRYFAGDKPALNLTQSGITLGTPLYMSPEQVQGHTVDHRSDIYSLGVTCYHLLAGEPPFRGATAFDVAIKHVQEQPRPLHDLCPDLPGELCAMIHKMMAKNPDDRYRSAREILRELARIRESLAANGAAPASGAHLQVSAFAASAVIPDPLAGSRQNGRASHASLPLASAPRRWRRWAIGLGVCGLAAAGGIVLAATRNPPTDPATAAAQNANVPSSPGLPDIRTDEFKKIVPMRERELLALITNENSKPEEVVQGYIELGLFYVREHRLDDAQDRFKKLEGKQFLGYPQVNRTLSMAARLGQAVVLAYRDAKDPKDQKALAQASNDLVMKVVNDPFPSLKAKDKDKGEKTFQAVVAFLIRHPNLHQAIMDALNRNMSTLGLTKLEPPPLELLRAPPRSSKP